MLSNILKRQAAVFGDACPFLAAVIVPAAGADDEGIAQHVAHVNGRLPDYARIESWVRAEHAFDSTSGVATSNGRPRREVIAAAYSASLFRSQEPHLVIPR